MIQNSTDNTNENSPDIYERMKVERENTLENFVVRPGTEKVKIAIKGFLSAARPICLVYGGVGNGKTHILHAAAIELYKQGLFTRVYIYDDILNVLRESINNPSMDYNEILDRYCQAERLIIDDVGAGSDTEFSNRILETIMVHRYGYRLMTLISTNKDINNLPERVLSRLKDKSVCYLVENKATDYRPEK